MSEPIEGQVVRVSGRGYGKTQRMREMAAQHNAYVAPANTSFIQEELEAQWEKLAGPRWRAKVFGQFHETPREELLRRLNCWARGIYPGLPINWKGL